MNDILAKCRLLKIEEVAELTGISRPTLYRWIAGGKLPAVRRGRLVRVREIDLAEFLERSVTSDKVVSINRRRRTA